MKGYVVDAAKRVIYPVDYQYGQMRRWLPGGLTIGHVFPTGDVLFVDDEGLLRKAECAFRVLARPDGQPMMSNGILTGPDSHDTTLAPVMTIAQLADEIEFLDVPEAMKWFYARAAEPAVVEHYGNKTSIVLANWHHIVTNLEGGTEGGYHPGRLV